MEKDVLIERLNQIGESLEKTGDALLLLGLGSVGTELGRLDEYSDLDFFVIVKPNLKTRFIDQLDWLETVYPLAYSFKNTKDGYKILFEDGIYGEFAVFEEEEMKDILFSPGRIVWKDPSFTNLEIVSPVRKAPSVRQESLSFAINEALTNLYVGLCRYARGEKLSGMKFIQNHALESILSVLHLIETEIEYYPDIFGNERRVEKRFPGFAGLMPELLQGYQQVPESALKMLEYLEEVYPVSQDMCREIRRLATMP
jgi:lincosamide nucleotidyltransferase B/F